MNPLHFRETLLKGQFPSSRLKSTCSFCFQTSFIFSLFQSPPGYSAGEKPDTAQFNYVFTESSSQEAVYSQLLSQFVPLILDGYDLTVLCAGQSGSGKSHSLFGAGLPLAMNEEDFGMTMRVARDVFQSVQDMVSVAKSVDSAIQNGQTLPETA